MNVRIKEIPLNDRPRERLLNKGSSSLSDEELLAIIFKTGTKDISAKNIAGNLLKQIKELSYLNEITLEELINIKGIGKTKACELLASIELGKRINKNVDNINKIKIVNAKSIFEYYKPLLSHEKQENFYCVYLDVKGHIIKDKKLYVGTINQSLVHPREIFKEAYLCSASGIICIHNHPSGVTVPSEMDSVFTEQLKQVGELLGIKLLDHIIVGQNEYFSFKEKGLI